MVQAWAVEVISDVITDVIERMAGTRGGLQNVPEEGCLLCGSMQGCCRVRRVTAVTQRPRMIGLRGADRERFYSIVRLRAGHGGWCGAGRIHTCSALARVQLHNPGTTADPARLENKQTNK